MEHNYINFQLVIAFQTNADGLCGVWRVKGMM